MGLEGFEDALLGGDPDAAVAEVQVHGEATVALGAGRCGAEAFDVQAFGAWPGSGLQGVEHRRWPAGVQVLAIAQGVEQLRGIQMAARFVVEVQLHPGRVQCAQGFVERGALPVAGAVHQSPVLVVRLAPAQHRQYRRDADAARHQAIALQVLVQPEVVARQAAGEGVAQAQLLMHETRAAAAIRCQAHADQVAVAFIGRVEQ
ncbi:hypothetical protein D3C79_819520 [compost metagenome]